MKIAEVRQRMVECMRLQRLSPATVKAYLAWVEQFAAFVVAQPAGVSHEEKIGAFLSHLVNRHHVSAATQKQAHNMDRAGSRAAVLGKIEALLTIGGKSWAYADALALRICKVEKVAWVADHELYKIVTALRKQAIREGWELEE